MELPVFDMYARSESSGDGSGEEIESLDSDEERYEIMEHVFCDICDIRPHERWYKCLVCDHDERSFRICKHCHDEELETDVHKTSHPVQCLITPQYFYLYFEGKFCPDATTESLTCPFCGKMGFERDYLCEHLFVHHSDNKERVSCPVCLSNPAVHVMKPYDLIKHFMDHIS